MKTYVTFPCDLFWPNAEDAAKPNPELFGKRLAANPEANPGQTQANPDTHNSARILPQFVDVCD
ncbi:MAG TPA: hypothetical protein VHY91_23430 [Pirellulales bacterium]|jgi:hypothetical protein|nr:hypothetical protein [Pirellulales bacterium]